MQTPLTRCQWLTDDPVYTKYHDKEWGEPVYNDRQLFEFLVLEGMQAGLSWITILKKRPNYRRLFDRLNPHKIIHYDDKKIADLLTDPGIIRNRLKVQAIIRNAHAYLALKAELGSFADYLWDFVDGEPIQNHWRTLKQVPSSTPISEHMSKSLKKRGFTFVGGTICYAFMQAVGMVNDHTTDCFRHAMLAQTHEN